MTCGISRAGASYVFSLKKPDQQAEGSGLPAGKTTNYPTRVRTDVSMFATSFKHEASAVDSSF
eukprot:110482-Alexandrium_andersonii.AAC.1